MKIVQALTIAALAAGSTAAHAGSFFYPAFEQGQKSTAARAGSDQLVTGRSVGYGNVWGTEMQLQAPVISPNGNPVLDDFAAHKQ